jgi:hypothetical protein
MGDLWRWTTGTIDPDIGAVFDEIRSEAQFGVFDVSSFTRVGVSLRRKTLYQATEYGQSGAAAGQGT